MSGLFSFVASVVYEANASTKTRRSAGEIYHALNRGNAWSEILRKEEDYAAFERILAVGLVMALGAEA